MSERELGEEGSYRRGIEQLKSDPYADSYWRNRGGEGKSPWSAQEKPMGAAETPTALRIQVGGGHYPKDAIQPVQFIESNSIPFLEGCVIKRMVRHGNKNGVEDLDKAIHEIQLIKELRYGS